ncbi:phospholipid transport system transporter-binding protein [Gammaproteobacteria bacterium]
MQIMLAGNMNSIEVSDIDNIHVNGELSFATAAELNRRGCVFIRQSLSPVFDLSKVTFGDNAGVALLVAWVRYAKGKGRKISFINLPKQLLDLIGASGLEEILSLEIIK